jgi:uncharacterized protein
LDALLANMLSPIVLAFVLGVIASLIRSDLEFPEALYSALSIYLLFAIGLKGGVALSETTPAEFIAPAFATLFLGLLTPLIAYLILRYLGAFDGINAAAIAAHYGSVSAVTFIAAQTFSQLKGYSTEGFLPALVAILEVPAIILALMLARIGTNLVGSWKEALHEVITGRSIVLLLGGLFIGLIVGEKGIEPISPFFVHGFQGALTLFLLEMGLVAARRLRTLKSVGPFLIAFGILVPILHGALGTWIGLQVGLSVGGAAILGTLASSASYIAAPAAVRIGLPEANPTFYLTAALGITFPFNLTLGIPIYFAISAWLGG